MRNKFWHHGVHVYYKMIISIGVALAAFILLYFTSIDESSRLMIAWDIFSLSLIIFYWISFYSTPQEFIARRALIEDSNRTIVLLLMVFILVAGLLSVVLLLTTKNVPKIIKNLHLYGAITGIVLSWCLLHTMLTGRYAYLYYSTPKNGSAGKGYGLEFPSEEKPNYLDFAYFSFVLGMTFQVSDVCITSGRIRHLALIHGLISFGYNA
ncbi:MAG: DUF1345 domain-containing protein, partial [Chitinophagaceae bacterium]|nr:DUF1345 domain-containing protein [Chitinophagaceae bacterium]